MIISPSDLERTAALHQQGLYVQAYVSAQTVCPINEWEGTAARVLAGRLALNLGAPTLGRTLHIRAWRHDQANGEARCSYARLLADYRGPLAAWQFLRKQGSLLDPTPRLEGEWLALHASILGRLRDFETAEEWLARAEKIDPDDPWVCVERAYLMELEDRYDEGLDAALRSLSLHPWYRSGVQAVSHLLVLLERDDEAVELLNQTSKHIESGGVVAQLAQLQIELGHFAEARESLERLVELLPLMEKGLAQWWNGQRSDVAYLLGDLESAAQYAELSDLPFYQAVATRLLESKADGHRVVLPVGFVRQHHKTCAPATLSAISRFWSMPADHLELVESICFDGTPAHSERQWAEQNGWTVREFCTNWEDVVALLDRRVAFTLTTVEPANAHLQAVIGYDSRRRTLLVRDPYIRQLGEFDAQETLDRYRATGPRGMALVPLNESALFDGLRLKEATLYDRLYQVQQALLAHDRVKAHEISQSILDEAGDEHRLTVQARLAIASYDADPIQVLACSEKLLALFPDDANLKLLKLSCLRTLTRRSERIDFLKAICSANGSDPLFFQKYAQELGTNDQEHPAALRLLRRAFRFRPLDAGNFQLLASIFWVHHRFDEALELYRFAACLEDTDERFVASYFTASRFFRQTHVALRFLESRFKRFGRRSSLPARTLFWAYEQVGRMSEALAVLKSSLELRRDDGELLLFAADAQARHGNFETATSLLDDADGKSQRSAWLRTAAAIASYRGEPNSALLCWRQVVDAEPLAIDANRAVAQLLSETDGPEAALEFLGQATARFPHNYALHQLLIEWLRNDLSATEAVLRHLIEIDSIDPWAHRELAFVLCQQRRFVEGFAEAELARQLEPGHTGCYYLLGKLYAESGSFEEAKAAYREAIRLSVDNDSAITELMSISHSAAERREALVFIKEELGQQVIFGDGLMAYREHARGTLDAEELLATLREALKERPDLCHAWSAMICQLIDIQRLDEALELARQATERFPLNPRVWYDLSLVYRGLLNSSGEIEALQQVLSINPGSSTAVRQLADAYQRAGELDKARVLLEQALVRGPLDPLNHGCLSDVLWKLGQKEAALERIQRALSLEPDYPWGWKALRDWSNESNCPQVATQCARDLTVQRSGEARSWLVLAQTLNDSSDLPERLSALERAIALNPSLIQAHCLRADLLADAKRFDEALAATRPAVFGNHLPSDLRNAAASIEAKRGNVEEAIKQMRALLVDDPNYYPGWNRVADWYQATQSTNDFVEAVQEMVRIAPQFSTSLAYLGDARMLTNDRDGAKEAFRQAMNLAPEYGYSGLTLFDLELADNDLQGAGETLEVLREHVGGEATTLRELQLAAKRKDLKLAEECLRELCFSPIRDRRLLDSAAASMAEAGWDKVVYQVLDDVLTQPGVSPVVGDVWVESRFARGEWKECKQVLDSLRESGELWRLTSIAYLEALANLQLAGPINRYLDEYKNALQEDAQTWGSIGVVFLEVSNFQGTLDWMSDWPSRSDVAPWMLWNYVLALRYLNRDAEAYEVGKLALLHPVDHVTNAHRLMLTLDETLAGDIAAADARFGELDFSALRDWDRFLYAIVSVILDFHRSRTEKKDAGSKAIERLMHIAKETPFFWGDRLLIRTHRRSVLSIARADGHIFTTATAIGHLLWFHAQKAFRGRNRS